MLPIFYFFWSLLNMSWTLDDLILIGERTEEEKYLTGSSFHDSEETYTCIKSSLSELWASAAVKFLPTDE